MSKSIVTGVFGSVMGIVSAIVGFLWGLRYTEFVSTHDAAVLIQDLPIIQPTTPVLERAIQLGYFLNLHVNDLLSSLAGLTFILAMLLVLTLILTGVGLYGLGKVEEKLMGNVSLIHGVAGAVLVFFLLLIGTVGSSTPTLVSPLVFYYAPSLFTQYPITVIFLLGGVPNVNAIFLWLGRKIVGFTIIIFGATFINMREGLENPGLSLATGVLFIIAGILLFAGALLLTYWIAIIILFVAFIMSALVFFGSREMG